MFDTEEIALSNFRNLPAFIKSELIADQGRYLRKR